MYQALIFLHSLMRWFVLVSLLYAVYRAIRGIVSAAAFSKTDNAVRHWTATIAHIQLMLGMVLYFKSPVAGLFRSNLKAAAQKFEVTFYGLVHPLLMLAAIVVITIGSAKEKRKETNPDKFKTMLTWFSLALVIILLAIPWPFSPLSNRPYLR
jgi:cytochrome bd-type quinol oxidase subunit 2